MGGLVEMIGVDECGGRLGDWAGLGTMRNGKKQDGDKITSPAPSSPNWATEKAGQHTAWRHPAGPVQTTGRIPYTVCQLSLSGYPCQGYLTVTRTEVL